MLLKILTFPLRLPIFLIFAVVAAVISGFTMTAGVLILLAVRLLSSASTLFTVLFTIAAAIEIGCLIFQPDKYSFTGNTPVKVLILLGGLYAVCFILSLLPNITEKAFGLLLTAAASIWGLAKLILFCR